MAFFTSQEDNVMWYFTTTEVAIVAHNWYFKFELFLRYGVKDMEESAKRIQKAAMGTPEDHFLILLAHNGPTGATQNLFLTMLACYVKY